MRSVAIVLVGVIAVVALSCGGAGAGSGVGPPQLAPGMPRIAAPSATEQACSIDEECVLAQDCCGCAAGGRLLAVNRESVDALSTGAEASCSDRCSASSRQHRTCSATEAICRGGRCIPRL